MRYSTNLGVALPGAVAFFSSGAPGTKTASADVALPSNTETTIADFSVSLTPRDGGTYYLTPRLFLAVQLGATAPSALVLKVYTSQTAGSLTVPPALLTNNALLSIQQAPIWINAAGPSPVTMTCGLTITPTGQAATLKAGSLVIWYALKEQD